MDSIVLPRFRAVMVIMSERSSLDIKKDYCLLSGSSCFAVADDPMLVLLDKRVNS